MANIFDGLKNISKEDLAQEVAILETINSKSITKIMAQRFGKQFLEASNSIAKLLGKRDDITFQEINEIPILISDTEKELRDLPMKYVLKRYISILIDKAEFNLKQTNKEALYENLAVKMINEAAIIFNIPQCYTPAMKADTIFVKYVDNMKRLINNNEKLSAYSKRLNRELLAREVKVLVKASQSTMTPRFKNMPSFIKSAVVREDALKSYNNYCELYKKLTEYKEELKGDEIILKKYRDQDEKIQIKFDKEKEIIKRYKIELENLKRKRVQIELEKAYKGNEFSECLQQLKYGFNESNENLRDRKDRLKEEIIFLNANLNKVISEYNYKLNYVEEFKRKINNLTDDSIIYEGSKIEARYHDLTREYDKLQVEVTEIYEYRKHELLNRWSIAFETFRFTEEVINQSLLLNPLNDLLYFERILTELKGYFDKTAISSGKKDNVYFIKAAFNGNEKNIYYKILSEPVKQIEIIRIN